MKRTALILLVPTFLSLAHAAAAEPPRGSITIERISQIRYPSAPAWSPDGKAVAFLWDCVGQAQDLYVVAPEAEAGGVD